MMSFLSGINIDLELFRQPIVDVIGWLGATMKSFTCNATDMGFLDM